MVIDWENKKMQIKAPHLQHLLRVIKEHKASFETISFSHIHRELNTYADKLSKDALALHLGLMEVREIKDEKIDNHLVCL